MILALLVSAHRCPFDTTPLAEAPSPGSLALVDNGKYSESWRELSRQFQNSISQEQWKQSVASARGLVGRFESRNLETAQPVKDPPNAPKGDYVICHFNANFARKSGAVETTTTARDTDKRWQTSGYFVK